MKKLLAILLALMLVMVSALALANGDGLGGNDGQNGDQSGSDSGNANTEGEPQAEGIMKDYIDGKKPSTTSSLDGSAGAEATAAIDVEIKKVINKETYTSSDKHPAVKPVFTVETGTETMSGGAAPTGVTMKMKEDKAIAEDAGTGTIVIHLPSYSKVGIYEYPVNEEATNIAGIVEEEDNKMTLKVTVIQDVENNKLVVAGVAFRQEGVKTDELDDIYKAGSLEVKKTVDGTMGDRSRSFPMTVTLTAPNGKTIESTITTNKSSATVTPASDKKSVTITFQLMHDETIQIDNIPEGVTYTVVEDAYDETAKTGTKHVASAMTDQEDKDAYYVTGEIDGTNVAAKEIKAGKTDSLSREVITNTKSIDVDTGVTLETSAYVLIMALALAGFVMMVIRRREEY